MPTNNPLIDLLNEAPAKQPAKTSVVSDNPLISALGEAPAQTAEAGKLYSGNLLSDVADTLSIPTYALAGLLQGKGIQRGVKERADWVKYLEETAPKSKRPFLKGPPGTTFELTPANVLGTAANIILDPTWLIPPAKIGKAIGAGAKALGVTGAAAKALEGSRVAAGLEKFTIPAVGEALRPSVRQQVKVLQRIFDQGTMEEARLLEPALNVMRDINKLTPGAQDLVAKYVEAGVDLEDAVRAAGFASADEARAAARAAGGSEFFRGEMVPTGVPGAKKNIAKLQGFNDVIGRTDEDLLAIQKKHLANAEAEREKLLAEADRLEKESMGPDGWPKDWGSYNKAYNIRQYVKSQTEPNILLRQEKIAGLERILEEQKVLEKITAENSDLLYLTSQRETAESYAKQIEKFPDILTGGKPEGYNPTVASLRAAPQNALDLTKFGEKGVITDREAAQILRDLGVGEEDIKAILERELRENGTGVGMQTYRLFRGRNLPPVRKALEEKGIDAVRYTEGVQDNWLFLKRSHVARAEDVAKLEQLPEAVRNRLLPPAVPTLAKDATAAAKQEAAKAARAAQVATETMSRKEVLALAKSKGLNPQLIQSLAERTIEADTAVGRALVEAGVISEDTFKAWEGQHLRRVYQRYEDTAKYIEDLRKTDPAAAAELESTMKNMGVEAARSKAPSLRPKIPGGAAAARKDLTLAERQALGEITQAGYRLGKGAQMGALAASRANMLKSIASELGSDAYKAGYLRMPEGKAWGALSGKWVPDFVHAQLNEWVRRPSALENLSRRAWGLWKFGKTVGNPATHVRNMMSNLLLADNAGLSPARLDIYGEALTDLARNGKWIQEAKQAGTAFIDTFASRELPEFLNAVNKAPGNVWQKVAQGFSKIGAKMGDAYQFEEQWGKLAIYIFKRKQGMDPEAAAKAAEQWLFNYRKVPRWIENLRSGRLGPLTVPFATFSYKAIPAYAKALYENPARVARWFKYGQGVERTAVAQPGELAQEGKVQPDWMKKGFWLRLPAKDKYGRPLYMDLSYIIPFNDAFQVSGLFGTGGTPAFASTPAIDLIEDLRRNQSRFTGRPIVPPGAVGNQAMMAQIKYLKDFLLPPLAGGYSFDKVKQSIMGIPDWRGRTTRLDVTMANVLLGMKTRPVDVNEERAFRIKEIQDQFKALRANMYNVATDPKLSQQEKNRLWSQGIDAMNQLAAEAAQYNQ